MNKENGWDSSSYVLLGPVALGYHVSKAVSKIMGTSLL